MRVLSNHSKQHILGLRSAKELSNYELKGFLGHLTVEKRYRILSVTKLLMNERVHVESSTYEVK